MASLQRTWRRAWSYEKQSWQIMTEFKLKRKRKKTRGKIECNSIFRNKKLAKRIAASIVAMQLLGGLGIDSVSASSNITIDNKTATQVDVKGNITDIHTNTFQGQNALNSFKDFNVASGDIVNLYFSNINNTLTANNLLNFVSGGNSSNINGMLNGIKNGQVGGNVYFLNPQGIMVGKSGVVNVGSFTAYTPTQSFMNSVFDSAGNVSTTAIATTLNGTVPIDRSGLISIQGKINAINDINLSAGALNNSGAIMSGAAFSSSKADFSDIVNATGVENANKLAVENGNIVISAVSDVTNSGTIATDGANNLNAGNITINAGNDIILASGSQISARGYGQNSAGGTVKSYAQHDATFDKGAVIDVSGGDLSGNAGAIDFSAKNQVTLAGGSFQAGAVKGKGGSVLIDPDTINVTADQNFSADTTYTTLNGDIDIAGGVTVQTNGHNLTMTAYGDGAVGNIDVGAGATLSTRNSDSNGASVGNSGDLTLTAKNITIDHDAKLLAGATGNFTGGDVNLNASYIADLNIVGYKSASASITIGDDFGGATITGKNVTAHALANADHSYLIDAVTSATGTTGDLTNIGDQLLNGETSIVSGAVQEAGLLTGIDVIYSQSKAAAAVTVKNGSQITASDAVTLKAETVAGAGSQPVIPIPLETSPPLAAGVTYAQVDASANVTVEKDAKITAKDLTVAAHNNATIDASISAEPKITDNSSGQTVSVAVAVSDAKVNSTATVAGTLNVADDVQIAATNEGSYSTDVTVKTPPDGVAAGGVAIGLRNTSATATLTGNVSDAATVGVFAVNDVANNAVKTSVTSGTTLTDDLENKLTTNVTNKVLDKLSSWLGIAALKPSKPTVVGSNQQSFRIGGAVTYAQSNDQASATIGDAISTTPAAQTVHASKSVAVGSEVKVINTDLTADVTANSGSSTGGNSGNISHNSYAVGLTFGTNTQNSLADIAGNVTITAPEIGVDSVTLTPIRSNIFSNTTSGKFDDSSTVGSIANVLENLADTTSVFNGGSSSKASSDGSSGSTDLAGSISILTFNNTSLTIVDAGAKLNLTGSATGAWSADPVTLEAGTAAETTTLGGKPVTYKPAVLANTVSFSFDKQADITASNDATLLFLGGPVLQLGGSAKGAGMTVNDVTVNSTAKALVREGVIIQGVTEHSDSGTPGLRQWTTDTVGLAPEVGISSNNQDKVISVVATAGVGGTFGLDGSIGITSLNEQSYAWLDDEATVKAKDLSLTAIDTPVLWTIAGGINYSQGGSAGIGIADNTVDSDTKAEIADNDTISNDGSVTNSSTRTSQKTIPEYSAANLTGAEIVSPDIDVEAHTGGSIGAVAVTGAVANSTDDKSPGLIDKIKDQYTAVLNKAASVVDLSQNPVTKGGKLLSQPDSPEIGLSGAGSASVNSTSLQNAATIDQVYIDQSKPTGYTNPASLTVRGTADPFILAVSGGAAVTRANSSSQTTKVGMTGSVAVNMIGDGNSATLSNSIVNGADKVAVQALSSGDQVAVGIGLAADVSSQGADSTFSANGSVSLTLDQTDASGNTKTLLRR